MSPDEAPLSPGPAPPPGRRVPPHVRAGLAWTGLALVLFGAGVWRQFGSLLEQDMAAVVTHTTPTLAPKALVNDASYVTWAVGRNARVLSSEPWRLFDAEPCAPVEKSLTLGEPLITLGAVGILPWLLTRDPIHTFNLTLLIVCFVGPLAMYLLVWDWTRQPAAGIAAGLVFAFHSMRTGDPLHPYGWDNGWTLLALLFARRLFERGRGSDAAALAGCIALQLGGSVYTLLGAVGLALPLLVWLFARHRRTLRPGPLGLVVVVTVGLALLLFLPAFETLRTEDIPSREAAQSFLRPSAFLAGRWANPGWPLLALALLGVALPQRLARAGQPRWPLLAGALLTTWLALGPNSPLPDLYDLASRGLTVLDVVRSPMHIQLAAQLALGVLAGLGGGALLQRVPEPRRPLAAAALVVFAAVVTLGPGAPGLASSDRYVFLELRPSAEKLAFFSELEARELEAGGSAGPLYEVPPASMRREGRSVLLSAYHRRRTSACAGSLRTPRQRELELLAGELPSDAALRRLAEAGFTTILLHDRGRSEYVDRFRERLDGPEGRLLREVHTGARMTAYAIELP